MSGSRTQALAARPLHVMHGGMLSPRNLVPFAWVFFSLSQVSEGFVRYALLNATQESQWTSDALCKSSGYDGLAVIDTPAKWQFAKMVLNGLPTGRKAWIGLEYMLVEGEPQWIGNVAAYTWGAWGSNEPVWTSTKVVASRDGSDWVWEVMSSNYYNHVLCYRQFTRMGFSRCPNDNVDLASATAEMTKTAASTEDCAMTCASVASCAYLTYDATTNDCVIYDEATVSPLISTDRGSANSFGLYSVRA